MITSMSPFLAFTGQARDALTHYLGALPGSECTTEVLYGPAEEAPEGMVRLAVLRIGDSTLRLIDVGMRDGFDLSPAMSVFVECDAPEEVEDIAPRLGAGGSVLMPVDTYPFATRFTWLSDKFGVNWQLISGPSLET